MTVQEFFDKYDRKGIDYDGKYGFQCTDNYRQFVKEVLGAKQSPVVTGAKDVWTSFLPEVFDQIKNTKSNFPKLGDIVVWGDLVGQFGHIAVCKEGDKDSFTSFDQNWPLNVDANGNGLGVCHFQGHNYNGVLGWLRPKTLPEPVQSPTTPENPDQVKIDLGEKLGVMEVQAIRSTILDLKQTIVNMTTEEAGLNTRITEMVKSRVTLAEKLNCTDDFAVIIAEVQKLIEKEDQLNGVTENPVEKLINALLNLFKKK